KCRRLELARTCVSCLRACAAALRECPDREPGDDRERQERGGDEDVQPTLPTPGGKPFTLEPALLAPRADRLCKDVVEDLVPVRPVDAVHDSVPRQRREYVSECALGDVRVLG